MENLSGAAKIIFHWPLVIFHWSLKKLCSSYLRNMDQSLAQDYLADVRSSFRAYRRLADKALAQLNDQDYFVKLDPESNSIAVIMKHIAGNMISRWTDFLTRDGEK